MSLSFYKPNSKNTGCGFSFQCGVDNKTKEPALYVKSIKQHSWDSNKKTGYFSKNSGDPEKNITVKFNEFECGEIISAIRNRREYSTFHSFGEDKTVIKLSPWDKKQKKSQKNSDGEWEEQWVTVPAFSLGFTRNGNQLFGMGVEPGEAEVVMEYLRFSLNNLFSVRFEKQSQKFIAKKQNQVEELSADDDTEAPF